MRNLRTPGIINRNHHNVYRMGMLLFLLHFAGISYGMEQEQVNIPEKLFFVVYPSRTPKIFIVEEFTDASVRQDAIKQDIFHRIQQRTEHVFMNFDGFAVYVSMTPNTERNLAHQQLKEFIEYEIIKKNIHNTVNNDEVDNNDARNYITRMQAMADAEFEYRLQSK